MSLREKIFTLILITISLCILIAVDIIVAAIIVYAFNINNPIFALSILYGVSMVISYWWIITGLKICVWYDWHRSYN